MDYNKQDEADLRELIDRYRSGYSVSYAVEKISARWAELGRECYDVAHRARSDIPIAESQQKILNKLMADLRDDDRHGA